MRTWARRFVLAATPMVVVAAGAAGWVIAGSETGHGGGSVTRSAATQHAIESHPTPSASLPATVTRPAPQPVPADTAAIVAAAAPGVIAAPPSGAAGATPSAPPEAASLL